MNNRVNSRYCGCPKCAAVFILTDEKLTQCDGMVRCGACREVFDANINLMEKTDDGFMPAEPVSVEPDERFDEQIDEQLDERDDAQSAGRNDDGESAEKEQPEKANTKHIQNQLKDSAMSGAENPFEYRATDSIDIHDDKQPDHKAPTISLLDFAAERVDSDSMSTAEQIESNSHSNSHPENRHNEEFAAINLKIDNPQGAEQESLDPAVSSRSQNPTLRDTTLGRMSNNRVEHYINDNANPFVTFIWLMVVAGFVFLMGMQVKYFFVERYAQDQTYRKYLVGFCKIAGCDLAPRQGSFEFTLTNTMIELHPSEPGAMRVTVKLVNEAKFAQPYPRLQLTLTDKAGRVVGRRTYSPELYLANGNDNVSENLVGQGELVSIVFNLARPHEKAVGFVVNIVPESASS